jgi:hypothetical protein
MPMATNSNARATAVRHYAPFGEALAIFDAIDQGGLLEAMPEDPADRARFQTAISLLEIAQQTLREAVGNPDHPISDECRCDGKEHCAPALS